MAIFQFRPSQLKKEWISALGPENILSFKDWLMFNPTPQQNIILFYTGNNRPSVIRAQDIGDTDIDLKDMPTNDIVIFDIQSSTFDIFYFIRNVLIYRPDDMWDTLEGMAMRRIVADYHEV